MKKQNVKIAQLAMISFYLLGLVAFLIIGDLSTTMNKVFFGLFLVLVLRELFRYYVLYLRPKQNNGDQ
ncbi:hypothetical protein GCM10012290_17840 [Halolactibacillus alkaliphilus]|uniref:Uncharacterized protein n=1 Tax=Halolactibacillus alkaliphilus TaxID=442899 RepID=A0A511X2G2_9BACI|nr:hypothetical protein [Halolactibacillus alkaliphilus]GEN57139.1 hypothetical protein HAL01_16030 [Halolactibacillus alkaliphilus]GGN72149.1 hypothetical protein GCM10012290_17840 [Halolactibacillus alkaliphilus]SFO88139.1 hypothetical protein SAMN05720591_11925 [Halolactibacillus alkaliphilus]